MKNSLAASVLLLLGVSVACPQALEVGIHAGVSRLSNRSLGTVSTPISAGAVETDTFSLQDGFRIGFRVTFNPQVYFGHEIGYAYNRTYLRDNGDPASDQGMAIHQGFYNFLGYLTKEGKRIRPFATGGVHFNNYVPPGSSVTQGGGETKFGFNYGAGLKARITSKYAIRLDIRQYQNGKPFSLPNNNGLLKMTEISAGFSLVL